MALSSTIAPGKKQYTRPSDSPPDACPECDGPVNPEQFARLTDSGPWLLLDPGCPACTRKRERDAEKLRQAGALAHYREAVPIRYRLLEDGGDTDFKHPDWKRHNGPAQLAGLNQWDQVAKPWAGIVGPAGCVKSRVIGHHARSHALLGTRLLWVNGSNLAWASGTTNDWARRTEANNHLKAFRTHAGLLLLDDLWKGKLDATYLANLYSILEHRNAHRLPILWTANTHPSHIGEHLPSDFRDPIIGRLLENTHLLDLTA